ncbi:pyridoxamine 5'-phosphate oxidase family protein [Moorena producens JHB]|uniref:Pyridoxamine 5'-phosphate oxidase family protein n=1 Tax=Moorena producens (strain JHB) TaxID=1454205 RepID=A0A1D9G075_MOOP1|nr:pyridoxamine 5'-phosphate oxidase family protein [Moorena producens]AOY80820.1 pyridoxamine 5'-phosphate oxidase family protein [Moorena producens JHB]
MSFHTGEIAVQTRSGVREEAEKLSSMITPVIKPAAQMLLTTQQLAIASSVDTNGLVWASLLTGQPGFVRVFDNQTVEINCIPIDRDPLYENLAQNGVLGLLVIDLTSRKRLRMNGLARVEGKGQIVMQTTEVFFNCPKYIQVRHLDTDTPESSEPEIRSFEALTTTEQDWITQSDTFFIASFNPETGADASHRGGYPGFIQVISDNQLVFPDYAGNNMFQTLGNLTVNPHAGLLFIDFERGNTLQLTGTAEVIWDQSRFTTVPGAQRLVEFHIDQVLETTNASPIRWRFGEYSAANPAVKKEILPDALVS